MSSHDDSLHRNLRRRRGSASTFPCVSCGKSAYEWAYQHNGPSSEPENYAPMCRSCHRKLDHKESLVLQRSWAKVRAEHPITREMQAAGGRAGKGKPGTPIGTERATAMGRAGGSARAARMKVDEALSLRMKEVAKNNLPKNRRRCKGCSVESSAAGIGNHQKSTGHRGYEEML